MITNFEIGYTPQNFRTLLEECGLSQLEFAELAGLHKNTVNYNANLKRVSQPKLQTWVFYIQTALENSKR